MTDRLTLAERLRAPSMTDTTATHIDRMRMAADEIERLTRELAELTADRDSWIEQASQRAQETVEAMQQVEAYRLRCEALHSAPREPLTDEQCDCRACIQTRGDSFAGIPRLLTEMIVCPQCGNKRCPHANNHRSACTGSNEPEQVGRAHGIGADAPSKE